MRAVPVLLLALVALLMGCGDTTVVRERDVDVPGTAVEKGRGDVDMNGAPDGTVRIVVVTHGQASSPFWAIVRNGVEAAARQMDAVVEYLSLIHI